MHSAFSRGVELLSEQELDSAQSQEPTVENPSEFASVNMEGICRVPKNVTQLKPVMDKLMCKVIMIAI